MILRKGMSRPLAAFVAVVRLRRAASYPAWRLQEVFHGKHIERIAGARSILCRRLSGPVRRPLP